MSDERNLFWPWIAALLFGLPVLYVLSSGPSQMLACRHRFDYSIPGGGFGQPVEKRVTDRGRWWPKLYAPLIWFSEKRLGEPINRYWGLFPIKKAKPFE